MSKTRGILYKLARRLGDVEAVSSGSSKKMANRVKNKYIGKRLYKVWKWPL